MLKRKLTMWMINYLRRRGFVVFYLEERNRNCDGGDFCWMKIYQRETAKETAKREQ